MRLPSLSSDSHIVQDNVPDQETMGSALERIARANHRSVNVHQYGWYETAAPTYIATAPEILRRTGASKVILLMNLNDFVPLGFSNGRYWQMHLRADGSYALKDVRPPVDTSRLAELRDMMTGSHLLLAVQRRASRVLGTLTQRLRRKRITQSQAPQTTKQEIARVSVHGLREAYGEKLLILYTPFCGIRCGDTPEAAETALLDACRTEQVHCVSMRRDMIDEAARNFRLARGFHNTAPGVGHLNSDGLELAARVAWREIGQSIPPAR